MFASTISSKKDFQPNRNAHIKKHYLLLCFIALFILEAFPQKSELKLLNDCKQNTPGFAKVDVIDKRAEKQTLGFVQIGGFNRIEQVEFNGNLNERIASFFESQNEEISIKSNICILLNEIYLSEKTEGATESGRLKVALRVFASDEADSYCEILRIDSVHSVFAMDVTKKLFNSVSDHFCGFSELAYESYLKKEKSTLNYSMAELMVLDSIEKSKIPVYNTYSYSSGIFTDYDQFKNNTSDGSVITIDTSNWERIKVYKWDAEKKKKRKVEFGSVYAVSDGRLLIKATSRGFYKMQKIGNDFYYIGQTNFTNLNNNNAVMWGIGFGLAGVAISTAVNNNKKGHVLFRLNYMKGNSIPVSKVPD